MAKGNISVQAENIFPIIKQFLYSDQEIFLRELVSNATDATQYLTIGVAAATGILSIISQYAAIREGEALIADLKEIKKASRLSKKIAASGEFLKLSAVAVVGLGAIPNAIARNKPCGSGFGQ